MRRPTRTRRLSIAAMGSFVAFVVVASAGLRSLWTADDWMVGTGRAIGLNDGHIFFAHGSRSIVHGPPHQSSPSSSYPFASFLGFSFRHIKIPLRKTTAEAHVYDVPFWFPLLLLLITPVHEERHRIAVTRQAAWTRSVQTHPS